MILSNQLTPGMTINVDGNIFRVESCIKMNVSKGSAFIKAKLRNLMTEEVIEKNFKSGMNVDEVTLDEHVIEYLYVEKNNYLFLDIGNLETILVFPAILGDKINYLKEGIRLKAMFYGDSVFSVELPQFLELMVIKTKSIDNKLTMSNSTKEAIMETGAKIEVPLFVEVGDIIKIDVAKSEFIQRV